MANFSDHIVNQRFKKVYKILEQRNLIKSKSDIAKKLGTYNHVVNSILKGDRNITVDQLNKLFEIYHINANYLFGLSEELFQDDFEEEVGFPSQSIKKLNNGGRRNITLVPEKALAGYALQHQNAEFLEKLIHFSIPGMDGELVAFEISGDSMMPTITNGDLVVCEIMERGEPLRDNQVYVIVTDVVVAKRIQQLRKGNVLKQLRLISDNNQVYQPYTVELEEIQQILRVKCRLTSHAIN
jgi:phage repressor protein C with HTH and peptisase S24 domain